MRVRVIGIDTPERGQCGYEAATRRTAELIEGGVILEFPEGRETEDKYGRTLAYVRTPATDDLGATLIREGYANARYDSRDGFESHRREELYRELSRNAEHRCPDLDAEDTNAQTMASGAKDEQP